MKHSLHFSTFLFLSVRCFTNGMTTLSSQPSESRVCRKPDCLHILEVAFCLETSSVATNHYSLRNKLSHFCITSRTRRCTHSRCCLLFLAHLCVLHKCWSLSWVTWHTFYSDTCPQIIQSFWFYEKKILPGFAIGYPGQRRVPQLVLYV